jgi:hypothetical protein
MALEMQIIHFMKNVMGAILSLILVTGLTATAEESACVKAFREANSEYFKTHAEIERKSNEATIGAWVGAAAGAGCVALRRTWVGAAGCVALGGLVGGGAYGYSAVLDAKLKRLFDAHRLYQAYFSFTSDETEQSEYAQTFVADLGADKQKETAALKEMSSLMDVGALCEGKRTLSYDEVIELMKARIFNAN